MSKRSRREERNTQNRKSAIKFDLEMNWVGIVIVGLAVACVVGMIIS